LVRRLEREGITDSDARIRKLYDWLFQREPTAAEWMKLKAFLQNSEMPDGPVSEQTWQLLAQTLLASNAFYFLE
jgi:hypothetical protein